jgi:hypothetical protein
VLTSSPSSSLPPEIASWGNVKWIGEDLQVSEISTPAIVVELVFCAAWCPGKIIFYKRLISRIEIYLLASYLR